MIHYFHRLTDNYEGHRFCQFELTKIHLKKHTWKRNINIRFINQMHTWMQLTSSSLSYFKEMALQRSTNSSMLIWRQPTHQIPDIDETPSIWWRIPLFAKKIFTIFKNRCTKTNFEVITIGYCMKYFFYTLIDNWWKCPTTIPIPWCSISYSKQSQLLRIYRKKN